MCQGLQIIQCIDIDYYKYFDFVPCLRSENQSENIKMNLKCDLKKVLNLIIFCDQNTEAIYEQCNQLILDFNPGMNIVG
jgi:hypothetical protein